MIVDERFGLPTDYTQELRTRPVDWGFGFFSEAVYYRTYSREIEGKQEQWADTVIRAVEGEFSILKWYMKRSGLRWDDGQWTYWAKQTADYIFDFKLLPPGRGLWAGGTEHIFKIGNAALNNCGFVDVQTLSEDAAWVMDHLMLGVGVGFTTYSAEFMPIRPFSEVSPVYYHIPDTREGWIESVRLLIESYEKPWSPETRFDYCDIRPKGSPIRGFGGTASGPGPLIELHVSLRQQLEAASRGLISPPQLVTDTMNMIGKCVVAGNVRRSAEIALGLPQDETFLSLKDAEKYPDRNGFPDGWGHLSNNSVVLRDNADFESLPDLVPGIIRNGEPGFINLQAIQKYGRIGKEKRDDAVGCNPCGEIPLESYELCNLCEVFPTRCSDNMEYHTALHLATMYATIISLLPSHDHRTNSVVTRNHRIGISLSGLADWKDQIGIPALTRKLRDGYKTVEQANTQMARLVGIAPSVRLTTVKPSGTISQLAGVSSGMHHPWDRWSIRRVRVGAGSPIVDILTAAGVPVEPDAKDPTNTLVFEFPLEFGGGVTRPQSEVSVWEQMAFAAMLQRDWSDNMVSCTTTFGPAEEGEIGHALGMFAPVLKSMSMLPDLDAYARALCLPPAYIQAPYEKITREEYRNRKKQIEQVDWDAFTGSDGQDSLYCESDYCEVKF